MFGASGYERRPADLYITEPWLTHALADSVHLPLRIWEPACGPGLMAETLHSRGHIVLPSDLYNHGYGIAGRDFLKATTAGGFAAIVTNPPFKLADDFVSHALGLMRPNRGLVAMLLRNDFDTASGRRRFFADHPAFCAKVTITRRPRWDWDDPDRPDNASPRHNFSWFVWNWRHQGPPFILYPTLRSSEKKEAGGSGGNERPASEAANSLSAG